MSKTILILGGSYAGLTTAHSLLKSILPSHKDLRVILVNPSDHFFFNIPSVRAALPGQYENEKLYHSIPAGFAYAGESFEFVEGKAEKVDPASNSVTISTVSGQRVQPYNFLVVATGSSTIGKSPWMANGNSYHNTKKYLSDMSKKIAAAESIVVGGGGTTGAELAGELGYVYGGKKEITLITASPALLSHTPFSPSQQQAASKRLSSLNVNQKYNARITSSESTAEGKVLLTLSTNTTHLADLYIPTTGLIPNTTLLPPQYLNSSSQVLTEPTLRMKGTTNIYAAGDVTSVQRSGMLIAKAQGMHVAKNLGLVLEGKEEVAYEAGKDVMIVSVGKKAGLGSVAGWSLPSFVVRYVKCPDLFLGLAKGFVDGSGI